MEIPIEITVNGEKREVPIKELRAGYMMQQDYSRKTAEVAREREQVGHERQSFQTERAQYKNQLDQLQGLVLATAAQELKDVNWNELATSNPAEYVRLTHRKAEINQLLSNIDAQKKEADARIEATKRQAYHQTSLETVAKLKAEVPDWNDDLYGKVLKNAAANGVDPKVASEWNELGVIKLALKAYQYDQLQAGKPATDKKVANVPKVIKPGATAAQSGKDKAGQAAAQRLAKTGKISDLADFLSARM